MTHVARRWDPWRPQTAAALGGGWVLGLAGLGAAWRGAERADSLGHAVGWLELGVIALVVSAAVVAVWLLDGHRTVRARQGDVATRIARLPVVDLALAARAPMPATDEPTELVAGQAMTKYHRPACPLTAGRPVRRSTRKAHVAAGRRPCAVCRP